MEDHLAVLDEDIAAGAVPLPLLPRHKQVRCQCTDYGLRTDRCMLVRTVVAPLSWWILQRCERELEQAPWAECVYVGAGSQLCAVVSAVLQALIDTSLPTVHGTASGRLHYPPAHGSHYQQQQPHGAGGTPAAGGGRAAAGAAGHLGAAALGPGYTPTGQAHGQLQTPAMQFDALGQQTALAGLHSHHLSGAGFGTPLSTLAGLYRSGSPALAAALGTQQSMLQAAVGSMGQPSLLGPGQPMTLFSCADPAAGADAFGLNGAASLLTWPYTSAGLPALSATQAYTLGAGGAPLMQPQQLQLPQSHFIGLPQQLYMQQPGLAAAAAASSAQLQQGLLQQQLGTGRVPSGFFLQQQQQQQVDGQQQQQQWLGFLQQPASSQVSEQQQQPQPQGSVQ